MADPNFQFDPVEGHNNITAFPTYPDKTTTRGLFQRLHDQTRDFINNTLIPWISNTFTSKTDITSSRKLSQTGDFTGTWNGVQMTAAEPGLSSAFNAHLAEKTTKNYTVRKPYYTLIDDDATNQFITIMKPILDTYGLKCTLAVNAGMVGTGDHMNWDNIESLAAQGFEIVNHGWIHQSPSELTLDQLKANYELEKAAFIAHGLSNYDYFVYPGVMDWKDAETINNLQQVYKCCYANTDAPDTYLPFDLYTIKRPYIADQTTTIQEIDKAIQNVGYAALFGHSWMPSFDIAYLSQNLQYLVDNSAKITYATVKEMVDNFGAVIQLGNVGGDNFTLDKNGNVDFSINGKKLRDLTNVNIMSFFNKDLPITDYRKNSISIGRIVSSDAINFGLPDVGTVQTYRFDGDNNDYHTYQEYTCASNGAIYRRRWLHTLGRWDYFFFPLAGVSVATSTRPKFAYQGNTIFDTTLSKPLWAKRAGFNVTHTTVARNMAYNVGDYIDHGSSSLFRCKVAGTTDPTTQPTYNESAAGNITIDGSAQFEFVGLTIQWEDANGTIV